MDIPMIYEENIKEAPAVKEYTISEAAELLRVERSTVWRWLDDGSFPGKRRKGLGETSPWLIPHADVKAVAKKLGLNIESNGDCE